MKSFFEEQPISDVTVPSNSVPDVLIVNVEIEHPVIPNEQHDAREQRIVRIEDIYPGPDRVRTDMDEQKLAELIGDIRTRGLLQPLTVRFNMLDYVIISGHRRYEAAKRIGLTTLPVYVISSELPEADQIAENHLHEKLGRADLTRAFGRLQSQGLSYRDIAKRIPLSKSTIGRILKPVKSEGEAAELPPTPKKGKHCSSEKQEEKRILDVLIKYLRSKTPAVRERFVRSLLSHCGTELEMNLNPDSIVIRSENVEQG